MITDNNLSVSSVSGSWPLPWSLLAVNPSWQCLCCQDPWVQILSNATTGCGWGPSLPGSLSGRPGRPTLSAPTWSPPHGVRSRGEPIRRATNRDAYVSGFRPVWLHCQRQSQGFHPRPLQIWQTWQRTCLPRRPFSCERVQQKRRLSLSGGFTTCRHPRPSPGREHNIIQYEIWNIKI